jgi:hypothetical protein
VTSPQVWLLVVCLLCGLLGVVADETVRLVAAWRHAKRRAGPR